MFGSSLFWMAIGYAAPETAAELQKDLAAGKVTVDEGESLAEALCDDAAAKAPAKYGKIIGDIKGLIVQAQAIEADINALKAPAAA